MLQQDNVVAAGSPGLAALGVEAAPLAAVAPDYLIRFAQVGPFRTPGGDAGGLRVCLETRGKARSEAGRHRKTCRRHVFRQP